MKNLLRKLTKFSALSFADKRKLLQIWLLLATISSLLKILPFNFFLKIYRFSLTLPPIFSATNSNSQRHLAELTTKAAAGFPFTINCLPIALAFKWLYRADETIILKIGVQRNDAFEFHAWVENHKRVVINDTTGNSFSVLWQII